MTERVISDDELKTKAWRARAKGRGLRWQIMRDVVAILSRFACTNTQAQDSLSLARGISHKKTRQFLDELQSSGAIKQVQGPDGYFFTTTDLGVSVYLGNRTNIPASVARVLFKLMLAKQFEVPKSEK